MTLDEQAKAMVARLLKAAQSSSAFQQGMAQAKSLRQSGNHEGRLDLYSWPTPEQTLEGGAAALIEAQAKRIAELEAGRVK